MEKMIDHILKLYKKHLKIDNKQEVILRYSLKLCISSIVGYAVALFIAWSFHAFSYVFVVMVTVSTLRVFSGGAHCSNATNCIIYGAITMNILGILSKRIEISTEIGILSIGGVFLYALWIVGKYAPKDTPGKPIATKQQHDKLKKRSIGVVGIWFFIVFLLIYYPTGQIHKLAYASAVGILWQTFTLTKTGYAFCHIADKLLRKCFIKKEGRTC